ncbi:acyl carrier protein, partial [Mesorhizobium sp. M00.F.Ca.ET.186.01.1.1]
AESLGLASIGRSQSFYDHGADSLIMAQVAGRLRDKLAEDPAQPAIPFDALLRQMLNYPTVADLAKFIRSREQEEQPQSEEAWTIHQQNSASNAVLIPYGT